MISDAVGLDRLSSILGYKLTKGDFRASTPNLPMRIAILGEANHANQSGLSTAATEITTAKQAGDLYGYGSVIHRAISILRPTTSDGVGGIPTIVYPQAEAGGAAAKIITVTPSGTASGNAVHTLIIEGERGIDGVSYDFSIATSDDAIAIGTKIGNVIAAALSCPFTASVNGSTGVATCTSKVYGLVENDLSISIDTNGNDAGISYSIASTQAGSGSPSISSALASFGNDWNTLVLSCYPTGNSTALTALETYNGVPDPKIPTGRYSGLVMKPFIAFVGSVADDPTSVTDGRKTQCTIAIAPGPLGKNLPFVYAANMLLKVAICAQNTPHLDVSNQYYNDASIPPAGTIPAMCSYTTRDAYLKKGSSTVDIQAGQFLMKDIVTTYHPDGEVPAQYAYVRNLILDWNVYYGYYLLEKQYVEGKLLANDGDNVTASDVITPKLWKQILSSYFTQLATRGLIADPDFSKASLQVGISSVNPRRFETFFRYKRTETVGIASTTAQAGFNYGNA